MSHAKPVFVLHAEQDEQTIERWLGCTEYSYYFVLREFRSVLETIGTVVTVREPVREEESDGQPSRGFDTARQIDALVETYQHLGHPALHMSFSAPQRTPMGLVSPIISVFAWEFCDIPCECWDNDWRNDWRTVLNSVRGAITHSSFAVRAVRATMGEDYPVVSIPAPVWDRFAAMRDPASPGPGLGARTLAIPVPRLDTGPGNACGPPIRGHGAMEIELNDSDMPSGLEAEPPPVLEPDSRPGHGFSLAGVVYTTVLSSRDGRKNWRDILRAFCFALRDDEDATLVMKLVGPTPTATAEIAAELARLRPFRCRVLAIEAFLSDDDYARLACASTYAVNASSGEGQCLPLMEYMSLGKPAVAPDHTAMADYLDHTNAFVVATSLEPACWPQDPRAMFRTWQHRIDMASLMQAFRESYRVARDDPERYRAMSKSATERLRGYCSTQVVRERLVQFLEPRLDAVPPTGSRATKPARG
jgi:glycosyltransferase involved in cell wall biosynthesis